MCEVSTEGAKGSWRVEREKRERRRKKGREGGKAGRLREREQAQRGEDKGQMLVLPEDDTLCGEAGPWMAGRRGSQHMHQRGWPSITGLLCQRLPCRTLGLDARIWSSLKAPSWIGNGHISSWWVIQTRLLEVSVQNKTDKWRAQNSRNRFPTSLAGQELKCWMKFI